MVRAGPVGTTLAAYPGEPIATGSGELTHSSNVGTLHTLSSGTANYKFNWTMPAAAAGGGAYASGTCVFINNTFVGNQAIGGNGGYGDPYGGDGGYANAPGLEVYSGTARNNVFANNTVTAGLKGGGYTTDGAPGVATTGALDASSVPTNNLFFGNGAEATTGTQAVFADPLFVSSTNFHVTSSSPAKGKGTSTGAPSIDLDGTTRLSPPTIGAYEAAAGGDANGDNAVTPADVVYILNFLFGNGPDPGASADVNGDAMVDTLDVFYLINYLFGGGASPA